MRPKRLPEIAWRVIEGEAVVVNPRSGLVYPFNPVATRFWELMDGDHSVEQIADAVLQEFEAEREQVLSDLTAFVREAQSRGLIEAVEGVGAVETKASQPGG